MASLPGVGFGGFAAGARPDLVEARRVSVLNLISTVARLSSNCCMVRGPMMVWNGGIVEQPGQADVGGRFIDLGAEGFIGFELGAVLFDASLAGLVGAATCGGFLQCATEQATREGTPGNQAQAKARHAGINSSSMVRALRL